jgi:hypothetical protein
MKDMKCSDEEKEAKKKKEKKEAEEAEAAEAAKKASKKEMDDKDDEDKDKMEARRIAVTSLLKESGIDEKHVDVERLVKLPIAEAKGEISRTKAIMESQKKSIMESMGVNPGNPAKGLSESDVKGASNNKLFSGLVR